MTRMEYWQFVTTADIDLRYWRLDADGVHLYGGIRGGDEYVMTGVRRVVDMGYYVLVYTKGIDGDVYDILGWHPGNELRDTLCPNLDNVLVRNRKPIVSDYGIPEVPEIDEDE